MPYVGIQNPKRQESVLGFLRHLNNLPENLRMTELARFLDAEYENGYQDGYSVGRDESYADAR